MKRIAYAVAAALLGCWANPARAETLPLFDGLPATYTPGTAFTFAVRVPQLTDFTRFDVELVFDTTTQNPSLFVSSVAPGVAPGGRYVFPSNGNFQSGSTLVQDSTQVSLNFVGSTGAGVLTTPGANDTLALVTVEPGAGLTGPITISLGAVEFDRNLEKQYDPPESVTIPQSDDPGPSPVPAPAGVVLLGIGGLLLGLRSRLARR